jgi:hypothetical protein
MGKVGVEDLEQLKTLRLGADDRAELIKTANECTFVFRTASGWPSGVIMSFVHIDGSYWVTAVEGRAHARAIGDDPRVSLVITNAGTGLPGRRMLAIRGLAIVHKDEAVRRRFFAAFTTKHAPKDPQAFERLLDSSKRLVIEVRPVAVTASHDSRKLPGDGRGGERPADWK